MNRHRITQLPGPRPRSRSSNPTRRAPSPRPAQPRRAQAWVGVIAVLTPVSSTKTSRFASIRRTFARLSPPLGLHFGSVPLAGMQGLLLVGQAEAAEVCRQRVVRVQAKPPHSFSCFRVASGCSAIRTASRTRSGKPRAGRGPPPWGLGARVPASRRLWTNRVTTRHCRGSVWRLDAGSPLLRRSPRRPAPGGPSSKVSWSASTCFKGLPARLLRPHSEIIRASNPKVNRAHWVTDTAKRCRLEARISRGG